jgi:glycosyltransferase involved in cell wall biosynthesis
MPARRLLVVTYFHPPDPTGGHRWAAMGHWLRSLGHEVTTITASAWGTLDDDLATDTHRTGDLVASSLLRRLLRRPPFASSTGSRATVVESPIALTRNVVPDIGLATWVPGALMATRRLVRERGIECVVTTSPMPSTHTIGLMLGRARPAWIADFRDGWRYEPLRPPWPTRAQDRLDGAIERRVVRSAEAVVGVTRPIAEDFSTRLGVATTHIPNGWDPRWDARASQASEVELEPSTVSVVHTGKMSGDVGTDPTPLFAAMRWIELNRPDAAQRLRLVLAGQPDSRLHELLEDADSTTVRYVGQLSRAGSIALQRSADALLLITPSLRPSVASGKLYEYLAAGKPIIALAKGSEAAQIIQATRTGVTVAHDDVEGIARSLLAAVDGTLAETYAPRDRDRYVYPAPAEEMADLVERAIERRRIL